MKIELLDKLKYLFSNSDKLTKYTYEGLVCSFIANEGATKKEILEANLYLTNLLPLDYILFLELFNGCTLFKVGEIGGLKFLSTFDLIKENKFQKQNLEEQWMDNVFLFSSCLGDGDYIGFKIINQYSYEILDCFGEEIPANWKPIGNSFDNFLEKLIDSKGEKFWL